MAKLVEFHDTLQRLHILTMQQVTTTTREDTTTTCAEGTRGNNGDSGEGK
jgi:hypothetical protein